MIVPLHQRSLPPSFSLHSHGHRQYRTTGLGLSTGSTAIIRGQGKTSRRQRAHTHRGKRPEGEVVVKGWPIAWLFPRAAHVSWVEGVRRTKGETDEAAAYDPQEGRRGEALAMHWCLRQAWVTKRRETGWGVGRGGEDEGRGGAMKRHAQPFS